MSDMQRFIRLILEIADSDWTYEDGTLIREDAKAFLDAMGEWPACCDKCEHLWRDCVCKDASDR